MNKSTYIITLNPAFKPKTCYIVFSHNYDIIIVYVVTQIKHINANIKKVSNCIDIVQILIKMS